MGHSYPPNLTGSTAPRIGGFLIPTIEKITSISDDDDVEQVDDKDLPTRTDNTAAHVREEIPTPQVDSGKEGSDDRKTRGWVRRPPSCLGRIPEEERGGDSGVSAKPSSSDGLGSVAGPSRSAFPR